MLAARRRVHDTKVSDFPDMLEIVFLAAPPGTFIGDIAHSVRIECIRPPLRVGTGIHRKPSLE
jgi:hypothetical protein